jgi:hypothetical protein
MDTQPDEEFFSEHTLAMRKAFAYCHDLVESRDPSMLMGGAKAPTTIAFTEDWGLSSQEFLKICRDAQESALSVTRQREEALGRFLRGVRQDFMEDAEAGDEAGVIRVGCSSDNMKVIDTLDDNAPSPLEFRQQFQNANCPCLIKGLDTTYFLEVQALRSKTSTGNDREGGTDKISQETSGVNRDWFRQALGNETKVPVRVQPTTDKGILDDEGRAKECDTREMTVEEWISLLDTAAVNGKASLGNNSHDTDDEKQHSDYYLKDWHLQAYLRHQQSADPKYGAALYHVPPYFQYDLLNSFLTKFTTNGDYVCLAAAMDLMSINFLRLICNSFLTIFLDVLLLGTQRISDIIAFRCP